MQQLRAGRMICSHFDSEMQYGMLSNSCQLLAVFIASTLHHPSLFYFLHNTYHHL